MASPRSQWIDANSASIWTRRNVGSFVILEPSRNVVYSSSVVQSKHKGQCPMSSALQGVCNHKHQHLLTKPFFQCASLSTSRYIIHASGIDRVGMVSDVSGQVIRNGGNVSDSTAAKLGQYFSLMMLVDLPNDKTDDLRAALTAMPDLNAALFEAKETTDFIPRVACKYLRFRAPVVQSMCLLIHPDSPAIDSGYFTLEGADNPGIVHTMTSALAAHGLSIDRMETDQELAPLGGTMLFRMRGICNAFEPLPKSFDLTSIKRELEALGDSLNCEVTMDDNVDDSSSGAFFVG